ncbi:hypothetical protein SAMN05216410_1786 [Sanguibacter gelidistatuariae]|uniref:Uncharacterized protein n=1 Tax=Sanguibacter gelidistatuariae TaxID=1814289 RepID=A0A1G6L7S4_9MICO|nr:hypothetical protein [Sanguibacter gelidistatuariae]SDC39294.1 hypothetical protein SAMN05216410_1786 [Sanguibacter gelidistatuariae]
MSALPPVPPAPPNADSAPVSTIPDASVPMPLAAPTQRPAWLLPVVTGVVGAVFGAAGMFVITSLQDSSSARADEAVLLDAVTACDLTDTSGITLADKNLTLTFDHKGDEDSSGVEFSAIACLLDELDTPSAVTSHMDQTTSQDGRQTETWDNITVSWSYHPDRGMDGLFTVAAK